MQYSAPQRTEMISHRNGAHTVISTPCVFHISPRMAWFVTALLYCVTEALAFYMGGL